MDSRIETDKRGRKSVRNVCLEPCAIENGMRLIGGKWTASIIYHLKDGPVRFNDLARMLGGASKKMIDQRLKELEARGMVLRTVVSTRPIAVTYELTAFGASALDVLDQLRQWSELHELNQVTPSELVEA
ncbi:MAG: helix-turn-helix domain-containing protein [Pseudomonadota bacterium]